MAEVVDREHGVDRRRALDRLYALIQRLRPLDRQVMLLYLEEEDAASIAEITGLSAANVSTKVQPDQTDSGPAVSSRALTMANEHDPTGEAPRSAISGRCGGSSRGRIRRCRSRRCGEGPRISTGKSSDGSRWAALTVALLIVKNVWEVWVDTDMLERAGDLFDAARAVVHRLPVLATLTRRGRSLDIGSGELHRALPGAAAAAARALARRMGIHSAVRAWLRTDHRGRGRSRAARRRRSRC